MTRRGWRIPVSVTRARLQEVSEGSTIPEISRNLLQVMASENVVSRRTKETTTGKGWIETSGKVFKVKMQFNAQAEICCRYFA